MIGGGNMYMDDSFEAMGPGPALAAGEYVIWKGKPKKSAYIADKALSLLPIAVFWAIFDLNFLRMAGGNGFHATAYSVSYSLSL